MHPVELAEKLFTWPKWKGMWDKADVLVLDEVSMVSCDLLEEVSSAGDGRCLKQGGWRGYIVMRRA